MYTKYKMKTKEKFTTLILPYCAVSKIYIRNRTSLFGKGEFRNMFILGGKSHETVENKRFQPLFKSFSHAIIVPRIFMERSGNAVSRNTIIGKCIWILREIRELERKGGILNRIADGPSGIFSVWPDGMPKTRYSQELVLLQRSDVNEAIDRLDKLYSELNRLIDILNEKDAA